MEVLAHSDFEIVNRAFSKQSEHYDSDDFKNPILTEWRNQVYAHLNKYLKPASIILELNSGTGIDAIRLAELGHFVHATDVAAGMINQIRKKVAKRALLNIFCTQLSFEKLDQLGIEPVDYIFSNFGGLNCTEDLTKVTRHFPSLLKPGGFVTLVIMPPVCLWEWFWIFKGHGKKAFRRLNKSGAIAHLEGEHFQTFYYSVREIKKALGDNFRLIACEGLGSLSPPPSKIEFAIQHPRFYTLLRRVDRFFSRIFPFNRWADHTIATFQKIK
jgi:ubiquinone/menaquinone biosynthesis C-methylase UbiE